MSTEEAIRFVIGKTAPEEAVMKVAMQILVEAEEEWPEPRLEAIERAARAVGIPPINEKASPEPEAGAMSTSDGLGADDEGRLAIVGGKVRLPGDPGDNLYNWLSLEEIAEREKQWNALAKIADDAKSPADVAEVVYQALEAIGKTTF